jgi:hypothetical protein
MTQSRSFGDAGQNARGPHVRILIEALADLQAQAPQRHVIGNVRVTRRAEQDRVLVAERVESVGRHHHAMLAVVVAAPAEILELESESVAARGDRFEHTLAGGHDLLADAVAGNGCNAVGLHWMSPLC